jgi:hypothetical protein
LYEQIKAIFTELVLNKNVKLMVNARNFGHIRSPYCALLQIQGDAIVIMASDLQDPFATYTQTRH